MSRQSSTAWQVVLPPELHAAACRGDAAASRALYESVAGPVHALAIRLVGRIAADDVFQDAMMAMFERLGDYRAEAPFGMWVRAITVNACLMHLRSPWRRLRGLFDEVGAALDSATPDGPLAAGGSAPLARLDVERLLARLPSVARTVLWLHDIEGYSHEDIAAVFGRTASFSKSQLSRAHARLRGLIAGEGGGTAQADVPRASAAILPPAAGEAARCAADEPAAGARPAADADASRAMARWGRGLEVRS